MSNMLSNGAAWLAGQMKNHAGTVVTYTRGTAATQLTATIGQTDLDLLVDVGPDIQSRAVDFLVQAAELDLGEGPTEPLPGDTISYCRGHETLTYEVTPIGESEQHFRWSDQFGNLYRIHTQRISVN